MERFIEVSEGISLWVEARGPASAPALLLIMGANASGLAWPDALVDRLAQDYRVIRYDHRDTGASTWAFETKPYPLTRLAEDALAVLDALGHERAHVVGLSLGGFLVQWLMVAHPERLRSATVMCASALGGTPPLADGTAQAPIDPELLEFWSHMFEPRTREQEIAWRLENWRRLNGRVLPFEPEEFRALEERIMAHAGRADNPGAHARADYSALMRGAELPRVTVPTLVIATPEDPTTPASSSQHLAESLPCSTLVTIEGMGHALPRAVVPRVAEAILRHVHAVDGTRE
ncbi:alpha/beta fold hydrolase [Stigmatella aurantiaca]|uniref:Esterase n=1 Tax=Stigmatella aurantiaca (strain DW4/3-1) TaxID=378806 RepID=Q09E73_STIAD|nr:alpha/beta hydrolase [Stigmatella aurantiaca]ADO74717.1 Esterase [Stigmatella aurantiaca DW4/3-1]EAU70095.1 10-carbomethoxy-13-deoxycarminomycin esterase [Stigmatella aurantiaca DW4/3-1]